MWNLFTVGSLHFPNDSAIANDTFSIRISKDFSKLLREVFQQHFLHEGKNSLKESFVYVHLEKLFWRKLCT